MSSAIGQSQLESALRLLFPHQNIIVNARDIQNLKSQNNKLLEIDCYIPNLLLAFEFQDEYHYTHAWYSHRSLDEVIAKDNFKSERARKENLSLIHIPCWWDLSIQSLQATINFARPELFFPSSSSPSFSSPSSSPSSSSSSSSSPSSLNLNPSEISLNPPLNFLTKCIIPDVGELMQAFVDEDSLYSISNINPWWLGEKYDGIRCVWHPHLSTLYSKRGIPISLPSSMQSQLNKINLFIDSELWLGRGNFLELQGIFASVQGIHWWDWLRVIGFDNPSPSVQDHPFEDRYTSLLYSFSPHHPLITIAFRLKCLSKPKLNTIMKLITQNGGEGVILRKPNSEYERGRSTSLLKVKMSISDAEALVLKTRPTYFLLQLPNGVKFKAERKEGEEAKEGDVVTIEYERIGKHIPIVARVVRIRRDLSWFYFVDEFLSGDSSSLFFHLGDVSAKFVFSRKPYQYWTTAYTKNIRKYLFSFAEKKRLNPLDPETWYSLSKSVLSEKATGMSAKDFSNILLHIFPDIGLDRKRFSITKKGIWNSIPNRKQFFESYAHQCSFDSLLPDNWYSVTYSSLLNHSPRFQKILDRYSGVAPGSVAHALIHLYPDIGLDLNRFQKFTHNYINWKDDNNKRKVLDEFAKSSGFDSLVPDNWYKIKLLELQKDKLLRSLLKVYNNNKVNLLTEVYPNLEKHKFPKLQPGYWKDPNNIKFAFDSFARENEFDPLIAENWYPITTILFSQDKRREQALNFYNKSIILGTLAIYPNIGLKGYKFQEISSNSQWTSPILRRAYFDYFAIGKGKDPLDPQTWYSFSSLDFKHLQHVLEYHGNSYYTAVQDLYPDINIDPSNWKHNYWGNPKNQKKHFDEFAQKNGFEPLVAENWYPWSIQSITPVQHTYNVAKHHNRSYSEALMAIYPQIGLKRENFRNYSFFRKEKKKVKTKSKQ